MGVGFLVGFADTCAGGLAKVIDLWKTVIMVPAGQSAELRPPGLWIQHRTPIQRVGSRCRFRGAKFLPQSSSCLETAEIFRGVLREVVAGPTKTKSHHSSFEHNSNAFPGPAGVDEPRDALLALSHVSRRGQSGHGQQ